MIAPETPDPREYVLQTAPAPTGVEIISVLNFKPTTGQSEKERGGFVSRFHLVWAIMTGHGTPMSIVSLLVAIIGAVWLIALAFDESRGGGLAAVAFSFAALVFLSASFSKDRRGVADERRRLGHPVNRSRRQLPLMPA